VPATRRPPALAGISLIRSLVGAFRWRGEIRLEDSVYVVTRCIKVGNKSIQLAQDIYANERCVTTAVVTLVGFDPVARTSVPLLAGWEPSASAT
jgi:acyl-CoA thioesterase FadM